MERGEERSIAIAVLTVISVVGMLASVTLVLQQPTGRVMQDSSVYITEDKANLAIECENRMQYAYFLGYDANYRVYCCPEDMNGQNECRFPKKLLITRTY